MIFIEKKQTRQDVNIPFFTMESVSDDAEFQQYFFSNYIETEKFVTGSNQVSENGLSLVVTSVWRDSEAANDFKNDATVKLKFFDRKDLYLQENNITEELIKYETIEQ